MTIGVEILPEALVLTRGRDFKWSFENLDANGQPVDYPAGSLYFEFPEIDDAGSPKKWTFTITGPQAAVKVESTDADTIPSRAKWQLVFLPAGETAGGDPITLGMVRVQGA